MKDWHTHLISYTSSNKVFLPHLQQCIHTFLKDLKQVPVEDWNSWQLLLGRESIKHSITHHEFAQSALVRAHPRLQAYVLKQTRGWEKSQPSSEGRVRLFGQPAAEKATTVASEKRAEKAATEFCFCSRARARKKGSPAEIGLPSSPPVGRKPRSTPQVGRKPQFPLPKDDPRVKAPPRGDPPVSSAWNFPLGNTHDGFQPVPFHPGIVTTTDAARGPGRLSRGCPGRASLVLSPSFADSRNRSSPPFPPPPESSARGKGAREHARSGYEAPSSCHCCP